MNEYVSVHGDRVEKIEELLKQAAITCEKYGRFSVQYLYKLEQIAYTIKKCCEEEG